MTRFSLPPSVFKRAALLLLAVWLGGCAATDIKQTNRPEEPPPPIEAPQFGEPVELITEEALFALTDEQKREFDKL